MIAQFSFAQDNTIADQPMVDLLQFVSGSLDLAARRASATSASASTQLEQLVLIVADGRFHEKVSGRPTKYGEPYGAHMMGE